MVEDEEYQAKRLRSWLYQQFIWTLLKLLFCVSISSSFRCKLIPVLLISRVPVWKTQDKATNISKNSNAFSSVQSLSRVRLCDPMNRSTPGLPVHHHLPELTQTHVHRVRDAIQSSHPLSSPSSPAPNPSQHQSLFQWINSSHEVAKVLEFQL